MGIACRLNMSAQGEKPSVSAPPWGHDDGNVESYKLQACSLWNDVISNHLKYKGTMSVQFGGRNDSDQRHAIFAISNLIGWAVESLR